MAQGDKGAEKKVEPKSDRRLKLLIGVVIVLAVIIVVGILSQKYNQVLIYALVIGAIILVLQYLNTSRQKPFNAEIAIQMADAYARNHGIELDVRLSNMNIEPINPSQIRLFFKNINRGFTCDARAGVIESSMRTNKITQLDIASNDISKGYAKGLLTSHRPIISNGNMIRSDDADVGGLQ